jgi:hypothetical protein
MAELTALSPEQKLLLDQYQQHKATFYKTLYSNNPDNWPGVASSFYDRMVSRTACLDSGFNPALYTTPPNF